MRRLFGDGAPEHRKNGRSVVAVKQMTAMTSGKAYFAAPGNLTQFILIAFLRRNKTRPR